MRIIVFLFAVLISLSATAQFVGGDQSLVINELDCDNNGTDTMEFIELYGPASLPLDGYVVVLFNGSSDQSYGAFDLDGYSLNSEGFFVLGSVAVANVDYVTNDNWLQNGPDAVAIYLGDAADFPTNTAITLDGLVDALVYETADNIDAGLMVLIEDGQLPADEQANGNQGTESLSRVPDGGAPFVTESYVAQEPTPGYTNELQCDGGLVLFTDVEAAETEACVDIEPSSVNLGFESTVGDANYVYVVTNENFEIIEVSASDSYSFLGQQLGLAYVFGLSYTGELEAATIEAGLSVYGIQSTECSSLSENMLIVNRVNCIPPNCDGGVLFVNGETEALAVCVSGDQTLVNVFYTSDTPEATYLYAITNQFGEIIEVIDFSEYDFGGYQAGTYFMYSVAYTGMLDSPSIFPGEPVTQINSDDCVSLSDPVTLTLVECEDGPGCSDLFFSEYIEGTSQNKALEIYNPTPFTIDLSNYSVSTYNDGAVVAVNTLNLSGQLAPDEVYVIANSAAIPAILNEADVTSNVTFFNGNDAIVLRNSGVAIDILGVVGENPGKNAPWVVDGGNGSMGEHTLVRSAAVTEGEVDWDIAQDQWEAYPQNTTTFLGSHAIVPCNYPEVPTLSFASEEINVQEGNTLTIAVNIAFPVIDTEVQVVYSGGTATEDLDFEQNFPITLNYVEGEFTPQTFSLVTIDDLDLEGAETIVLELQEVTDVDFVIASLTVNILPSDYEIPVYTISEVSGNNDVFVADSLGVECELRGIVHGLNTNPEGLQFTLIDDTDGINVFHPENNFNYVVTEGDSIHVVGHIDQFSGLTQIVPDTITLETPGLPLYQAELVDELNEETESMMIQLKCMEIVDAAQWTNTEPGFSVEVTDGTDVFEMRIDSDTDLMGSEAPTGVFSIIGIGGQYDSSEPFDAGYQILPRYLDDLSEPVSAFFEAPDFVLVGEAFVLVNQSVGAGNYQWSFGDGTNSTEQAPEHSYAAPGLYTITLTAFDVTGTCTDQYTWQIDVDFTGVNEDPARSFNLFPNPASGQLQLSGLSAGAELRMIDIAGRVVLMKRADRTFMSVDISELSSGCYLVKMSIKGVVSTRRLIIE